MISLSFHLLICTVTAVVSASWSVLNCSGHSPVIGPELCGGTKTEKGKAMGWLMGSLVSLSSKLRKN
jgi:hypothetical protein